MTEPTYIESSASFDDRRIYRYSLVRRWDSGPTCLWIMLNPSTADETKLDPTLRRVLGFTQSWDPESINGITLYPPYKRFGAFEVCNLYAFRSTDPEALWARTLFDPVSGSHVPFDPIGPDNDEAIQIAAKRAQLVIVGWGTNARPERERKVAQLLADVGVQPYALGLAKKGQPVHPLYMPASKKPVPWHAKGLR